MTTSKTVSPEYACTSAQFGGAVPPLCTPVAEGFHMPAEFEPHTATIMIWPERPGSWTYGAAAAREAFMSVIAAIAPGEKVYVAVGPQGIDSALTMLFQGHTQPGTVTDSWCFDSNDNSLSAEAWRNNVEVVLLESDDAWARDIAPTFVVHESTMRDVPPVRAVTWQFNAWGGLVDGAYAHWERDSAFARGFCKRYGYETYDASPFVLEGGSIHSDGQGTLLVTERCLLSAGRNPNLSKQDIENRLKAYLGINKVLWLPRGIYNDETNEHVDNICAFLRPGEVVLGWTDNTNDPQYELSNACLTYLEHETDAQGRKLVIHKLPIPDVPICITAHDVAGFQFEADEEVRTPGERLAASYVNFYFSNSALVLPVFGGQNASSDARTISLLQAWMPDCKVVPVPARDILVGGGNIHCITQQIPAPPSGTAASRHA